MRIQIRKINDKYHDTEMYTAIFQSHVRKYIGSSREDDRILMIPFVIKQENVITWWSTGDIEQYYAINHLLGSRKYVYVNPVNGWAVRLWYILNQVSASYVVTSIAVLWYILWSLWNGTEYISRGHYSDVILSVMLSQITSLTIVYSTVHSAVDQRKYQSSMSLAFVRVTSKFPAQRASNAENDFIWWRHHEILTNEVTVMKFVLN